MAEVGKYNKLKVLRKADHGFYLGGEDDEDILLPNIYVPDNCTIGQEINVFIYRDSEDRLIATTLEPLAKAGEFAGLKVVAATKVGAFLDWGLAKDLLVPFSEHVPLAEYFPGLFYFLDKLDLGIGNFAVGDSIKVFSFIPRSGEQRVRFVMGICYNSVFQ